MKVVLIIAALGMVGCGEREINVNVTQDVSQEQENSQDQNIKFVVINDVRFKCKQINDQDNWR